MSPAPDLPAAGSGFDYSHAGAASRADAAITAYHQQTLDERLYGLILLFALVCAAIVVVSLWRNRRAMAESAAQSTIRASDAAVDKAANLRLWWRKQAEKARHDRK